MVSTRAQSKAEATSKGKPSASAVKKGSTNAKQPTASTKTINETQVDLSRGRSTTDMASADNITDPGMVTGAVVELVHDNLFDAWAVDPHHSMQFIFDAVSPARIFHPTRKYSDKSPFVTYTQKNINIATEEDPNVDRLPFVPKPYK